MHYSVNVFYGSYPLNPFCNSQKREKEREAGCIPSRGTPGDLSCIGQSGIRQVCIHTSVYSPYGTKVNILMEPGKGDVFSTATAFLL